MDVVQYFGCFVLRVYLANYERERQKFLGGVRKVCGYAKGLVRRRLVGILAHFVGFQLQQEFMNDLCQYCSFGRLKKKDNFSICRFSKTKKSILPLDLKV